MTLPPGTVYLVGVGVGGLDTLTYRASQVLQQADVALVDNLAQSAILTLLPEHCTIVQVGKRGGQPSMPQPRIDLLTIEYCQQGLRVVRLKSGDPGIFGRLVQEVRALNTAGCCYEIVPGVSSAIAGPLLAAIPLTDAALSHTFAVSTAHDLDQLCWPALAQLDTVVFLMGTRHLGQICQRLIEAGLSPTTPIALIRHAGRVNQQVWTGQVDTFAATMTAQLGSLSPAVIVVGQVVTLKDELAPATPSNMNVTDRPLEGKTVLVTRANAQSGVLSDRLQALGATVTEMPTLEIVPPSDVAPLDRAIADLDGFDWLVLASGNATDAFFQRLQSSGLDSRALHTVSIAVVGRKTAECLARQGITPDFVPEEYVADALVESLPVSEGDRLLFPRVESGGRPTLIEGLTKRGVKVLEVAAYQSRCPLDIPPQPLALLNNQQVDVLTFASSKTVLHFHQLVRGAGLEMSRLDRAKVVAIGPKTAETCREYLGRVDACAREYTLDGLVDAVVQLS
ncbi:MAG: uroporphyrinogen-III C-methyltransferase [Cyanobacteria bacterium P01_A01_bin.3]